MTAVCVRTVRQKIRDQAEQIRAAIDGRRYTSARAREWAAMSHEYRMALMLLAGIDGDIGSLSMRSWDELPAGEQISVQVAARGLFASLDKSISLRMRAG